jgi:putative protease
MTLRDANRGGCAHSCRWNYQLKANNQLVSEVPFSMSSKDLESLQMIPALIDAKVASLKIEGRMKSLHYIATVVKTYRMLIDEYLSTHKVSDFYYYERQLAKAENRLAASGFLKGKPGVNEQLYQMRSEKPLQNFVGLVLSFNQKTMTATIEQRNYFSVGERLEVFSPDQKERYFTVDEIKTLDGETIDTARHPQEKLLIKLPFKVVKNTMLRKTDVSTNL